MTAAPRLKIRWIVSGVTGDRESGWSSALASNRYRAIFPAEALLRAGHDVDLLEAETWRWRHADHDAVFVIGKLLPGRDLDHFHAVSRSVLEQAALAVEAGVRVIADFNDDHFEHPLLQAHWRGLAQTAAVCTVGSEAMGQVLTRHTKAPAIVVGDPLGSPRGEPKVFSRESGLSKLARNLLSGGRVPKLQFVWYGNPGNWPAMEKWAKQLAPLSSEQPFLLWVVTQAHESIQRFVDAFNKAHAPAAIAELVPWDEETQWRTVADADVVLIPTDLTDPRKTVKTSNRLVDALHAGRYVIASPLPAYVAFSDAAVLTDDPLASARAYLADAGAALERIQRGQAHVQSLHGTEAIARDWMSALTAPLPARREADAAALPPVAAPADLIRLNLGCGDKILPGYVNVDVVEARAGRQPDVVCDLRNLSAFASDSADEVLAVHVVEHFWRWEVEAILREWVRVLKPGGRMVLECPNLQSACEAFLADPEAGSLPDKSGQRTMWVFYGDPQWRDPLMVHRWGYTPRSLARLMETVGLVNARQEPAQYKLREPRDMRIVAEKPPDRIAKTVTP